MMEVNWTNGRAMWPRAQFAYRKDPRFSYCMHLPASLRNGGPAPRLLVAVHGTGRGCMAYRDAFSPFAEKNNYVILSPLFPIGVLGDDHADGYKYILEGDIRYDDVLLGMVEEVEATLGLSFGRFSLFGFSGGAHFAHRFFYLHPRRLASVSVGAPGGVTLLDDTRDFWIGTRDFQQRFGARPDVEAMKEVPSQLIVGADDTQIIIYPPQYAHHAEDMESLGRNRVERNATLYRNWRDHGLATTQSTIPGIAHEGLKTMPAVEEFLLGLAGGAGNRA